MSPRNESKANSRGSAKVNGNRDAAKQRATSAAARLRSVGSRRAEEAGADPLIDPQPTARVAPDPLVEPPHLHSVPPATESSTVQAWPGAESAEPPLGRESSGAVVEAEADPVAGTTATEPVDKAAEPKARAPKKATAAGSGKAAGALVGRVSDAAMTVPALDATLELLSGPEARLEMSGERIHKTTFELPTSLVDAIARWELELVRTSGRRVYRERLFDAALSDLPESPEAIIEVAQSLAASYRFGETEQVGTRVRERHSLMLATMRMEMRARRVKGLYLKNIYTAAIVNYLKRNGVSLPE